MHVLNRDVVFPNNDKTDKTASVYDDVYAPDEFGNKLC